MASNLVDEALIQLLKKNPIAVIRKIYFLLSRDIIDVKLCEYSKHPIRKQNTFESYTQF